MEDIVKHIKEHKKLIGAALIGLFLAVVFVPSTSILAPAIASNPNPTGQDSGGVAGTGTYGNDHSCYVRTNGLPEGCRTPS
jgi:hypothetical protein